MQKDPISKEELLIKLESWQRHYLKTCKKRSGRKRKAKMNDYPIQKKKKISPAKN